MKCTQHCQKITNKKKKRQAKWSVVVVEIDTDICCWLVVSCMRLAGWRAHIHIRIQKTRNKKDQHLHLPTLVSGTPRSPLTFFSSTAFVFQRTSILSIFFHSENALFQLCHCWTVHLVQMALKKPTFLFELAPWRLYLQSMLLCLHLVPFFNEIWEWYISATLMQASMFGYPKSWLSASC